MCFKYVRSILRGNARYKQALQIHAIIFKLINMELLFHSLELVLNSLQQYLYMLVLPAKLWTYQWWQQRLLHDLYHYKLYCCPYSWLSFLDLKQDAVCHAKWISLSHFVIDPCNWYSRQQGIQPWMKDITSIAEALVTNMLHSSCHLQVPRQLSVIVYYVDLLTFERKRYMRIFSRKITLLF